MSDAPDELESAMILGDPGETVSLDTIKAMARAVRDAGFIRLHIHAWVEEADTRRVDHDFPTEHWTELCRCGTRQWQSRLIEGEA